MEKKYIRVCSKRSSGQAISEFLVLAAAIIPLFLLLPMIGKYQDLSHHIQMASRYAAFDATVRNPGQNSWKPEDELASEVRRRFFTNSDALIKTGDSPSNSDDQRNFQWSDPFANPLIKDVTKDVLVSYGSGKGSSSDDALSSSTDGSSFAVHDELNLKARGIYTANVTVNISQLPDGIKSIEPFNTMKLSMTRSMSILIDPWTAKDPYDVKSHLEFSEVIYPSKAHTALKAFVAPGIVGLDWPGPFVPPNLGDTTYWKDVVPYDRVNGSLIP